MTAEESQEQETQQPRKNTVLRLTPIKSLFALLVVAAAVGLSIGLTYYFTRKAFDTTGGNGKEDQPIVDDNSPSAEELRLPTTIKPLTYDLVIKTYLPNYVNYPPEKDFAIDGTVVIAMEVVEPTKSIVLNSKNISVIADQCELFSNNQKLDIEKIVDQPRLEKVEFVLKKKLEKNQKITLKIVYIGLINDMLGGLYRTTYTDKDGTTKIAACTHMEPTDARLMVPCFDEPTFKANWTVTVIHPKGTSAVSNGIEKGEGEVSGDWVTTRFDPTPRMSSYLIALVISEFEYIQDYTKSGVRFRIWARPEAMKMTEYAMEAGIKCLDYYEDFFGIKFPLPKQDMVALPDFSSGAMENWGLITYREGSVLYDENLYGPMNKERVAEVIAHELAHQWFGNLVTMKWWDNLWLNEGFASFVEYIGADFISDGLWEMKDFFLLAPYTSGITADAVASSHPLSFRIDKAADVSEAFDDITYRKGASVLQVLLNLVGDENFKQSVSRYLKKFSYDNAAAEDLWAAFDETVQGITGPNGGPLKMSEFAPQWTTQMGFPVLTVESINATTLKVTQKRYRQNKDAKEPEKYRHPTYGFKWDVPLWYQEDEQQVKRTWLKREEPLYFHVSNSDSSVVVNAERRAFCRSNYDANGWRNIMRRLKQNHKVYGPRTRNALISDAFAAAAVEEMDYETVFEMLKYTVKEEDYLPWKEAISGFKTILDFFGSEPESQWASEYMRKLMKPIYDKSSIKFIEENYKKDSLFFKNNLQIAVIDTYCGLGGKECLEEMKKLFDEEVMKKCRPGQQATDCVKVTAPLRKTVYCYGVQEGGDEAFDKVMELYNAEQVQLEKDSLREALGCHKDVTALKGLLMLALDRNSSFVRLQDAHDVFNIVSRNPVGNELLFNFLTERWEEILESLSIRHRSVDRVIKACTRGLRSREQVQQLKNLYKNDKRAREYGAFGGAIERSEHRVKWIEKHFRKLAAFFKKSNS
uniref:Aminopeptidase n=1 Tax=Haemonchus contortus TaxID=6289 RepID=Q9U5P6_HAECO|nr:microsomal aminopeptidase [Haemonchus contortus]